MKSRREMLAEGDVSTINVWPYRTVAVLMRLILPMVLEAGYQIAVLGEFSCPNSTALPFTSH
jgi:hypothetical protein